MKGIINKALFAMLVSTMVFNMSHAMNQLNQTKEYFTSSIRNAQDWKNNTALPWIETQCNTGKEAFDKGFELAQTGFESAKSGFNTLAAKASELINDQNNVSKFIKEHQDMLGIAAAGILTGIAIESGAARKIANGIKAVGRGVKSTIGKTYNVISNNKALIFGAGMLCATGICLNKDTLAKIALEKDIINPVSSFVTQHASYFKENSENILKKIGLFSIAGLSTVALNRISK